MSAVARKPGPKPKPPLRGDDERDALFLANLGLASVMLEHLSPAQVRRLGGWDEARQIARFAILRAAAMWDETRGWKFTTYACQAIRHAILNTLRDRSGLIRTPEQRTLNPEYRAAYERAQLVLSLDKRCAGEWGDCALGDLVAAPPEPEADEDVANALRTLDRRSRDILHALYWEGYSRSELAEREGISTSRIEQIVKRALARLRVALGKAEDDDNAA